MSESAEEIVLRHNRERMYNKLINEHPDALIREIALEVAKGTYTWTEAAASQIYGPAIEAMHANYVTDEFEGEAPVADWFSVLEARHQRLVAAVEDHGEAALLNSELLT